MHLEAIWIGTRERSGEERFPVARCTRDSGGLIFGVHSFIFLFSIIIKQFNTKIINIKKIKKRKKQHNVRR